MGSNSHCLGAHNLHSKGLQDTLSEHLQRFGAFSTPVWVTAQQSSGHLQNLEGGKADNCYGKCGKVLIDFSPPSKIKLFYSLPNPSIPQAAPGPSLQPQAHLGNVEMSEPGWGYQSTVPGTNSSLGAQVTSVHSLGKWLLSCQESALETLCSAGTTALAAAKANKVPFCAPFIPTNKYAGGGKALERQRASDSL